MAKYLRPRRGSTNNAKSVVLVKGEMFMEYPNGRIGMEPGRIIVGNGTNACSSINYQPNSDNSWQPFITDPALFVPRFTNPSGPSSSASASYEWGASTTSISNIGDGSATGKKLPAIIGAIKETLIHNTNSIANLANGKVSKHSSKSGSSGGNPSTYIWDYPDNNTDDRYLQYFYEEALSSYNTTYARNIWLNSQASQIIVEQNTITNNGDDWQEAEIMPYSIRLYEMDGNYTEKGFIKMIGNTGSTDDYSISRRYISGSSTYGWGNNTVGIISLNEYLKNVNRYDSTNGSSYYIGTRNGKPFYRKRLMYNLGTVSTNTEKLVSSTDLKGVDGPIINSESFVHIVGPNYLIPVNSQYFTVYTTNSATSSIYIRQGFSSVSSLTLYLWVDFNLA